MSSIVLERVFWCSSLAFAACSVQAQEARSVLSCQTEKIERNALKQAPEGARRVSEHVLEVASKGQPQRFVDKPPHDEGGMSGLHWRYCGYDARAKAHLIEMTANGLFSGSLVLDESGRRLHAGHTAVFSPDGKAFLAIEQEDGVDGENWAVYDRNGRKKWKGYAGKIAKVNGVDVVSSTFERPQWTAQGELQAHYVCAVSKSEGVLTLVRSSSGNWSWRGHEKCP